MRWGWAVPLLVSILSSSVALANVHVDVQGIDGELRDNVEALLSIVRAPDDANESAVRRAHDRASEEIRLALQPFGYYRPEIETSLDSDGENWRARYVIDAGPQITIRTVDAQVTGAGVDDAGFEKILATFPVQSGAPLAHAQYETGKRKLLGYAFRKGYFDAKFDSAAILVTVSEDRADVVLHLDSGPRYEFGPVTLEQDVLNDDRVRGYVTIQSGEPYDVDPLVQMQSELSSTPYFASVEIRSKTEQAEDLRVPIDVVLAPAKTQRYEFGAGYGTDTGVRGKINAQWRRLNRKGHHAEAEIEASQIEYSASAKYNIPWPYPDTKVLTFFGAIGYFEPRWASSWRTAVGVNLGHSRWGWREVFSLAFEHESFTIAEQDGSSSLVIPGLSWTRTRSDDPIFPRRGYRLRLDVKGAHDAVLSNVTFGQVWAEGKIVQGIAPRTRVLVRGTAARTFTDQFSALPPTQRFVTGGDQTVRGYAYESLGPRNGAGDIVGGNSLAIASAEIDFLFWKTLGIAAFVDTGNAFDDFVGQSSVGTGGGLRWVSPIGVVRLDLGVGVSEDDNPLRLHLAIGPDL